VLLIKLISGAFRTSSSGLSGNVHHAADLAPVTEVCNTVTVGLSLGECLSMTGILFSSNVGRYRLALCGSCVWAL
jgi:hypothetical protein